MLQARQPQPQQESSWTPSQPEPFTFDGFTGLNTKPSRTAIDDQEMYICDGFMPIGQNNLRTLPGIGTSIFSAPTGTTIVWFDFGNVGNNYVAMVVTSNGALYQVNTSTGTSTLIGAAGTIINPSANLIALTQAGSRFLILIAAQPNGLFIWDGVNLFQAGTLGPDITILNSGQYTATPTLTIWGGSGSGAAATCTLFNGFGYNTSIISAGSGYISNDFGVIISNGGGVNNKSAKLQGYVTAGSVSSVGIIDGGYGYSSVASLVFYGGVGVGATGTVYTTASSISSVGITYGGSSYVLPPTPYVVDAYNSIMQGYVDTMPFGVTGNAIETYVGRLWLVNGASYSYSAASSLVNFASAYGGGTAASVDAFLRNTFAGVKQSNGFLYLIGDSSINAISGVQQSGTPPRTTYTNQNTDPEVGSNWPRTISVMNRNIVFANAQGIYTCAGGTVAKISDNLDGIYATVKTLGNFIPSAAKATIFGIRCWMLLVPIVDQVTKNVTNKLLMTDGKKWWTSNQDVTLTYIATQTQNSVFTAFGTDGSNIYPLFTTPSTAFTKTVQSKLISQPGIQLEKTGVRLWGMVNYYDATSPNIIVSVDSETSSNPQTYTLSPLIANWVNNAGLPVTWKTNSGANVTWLVTGNGIVVFPPIAVGQQGVTLGLTLSTQAADMAVVSLSLGWEIWGYRG